MSPSSRKRDDTVGHYEYMHESVDHVLKASKSQQRQFQNTLKVFSTDKTSIHIVIGERNCTQFLEIKIQN